MTEWNFIFVKFPLYHTLQHKQKKQEALTKKQTGAALFSAACSLLFAKWSHPLRSKP